MKRCGRCRYEKDESAFHKNKARPGGLAWQCRDCAKADALHRPPADRRAYKQKWAESNRARIRGYRAKYREARQRETRVWRLRTAYGLTPESLERLAASQARCCACCGNRRTLVVDHCHKTGKVRGLLCGRCNCALGLVGDGVAGAEALVRYLRVFVDREMEAFNRGVA